MLRKRTVSLILSAIMLASCFNICSFAEGEANVPLHFTMDYSAMSDSDITAYTSTSEKMTFKLDNDSTVNKKVLQITTESGIAKGSQLATIPLAQSIDTTKGAFTVTIKAKLPERVKTGNSYENRVLRGFPILSDASSDNIFGIAQASGGSKFSTNADGRTDALWMQKASDNKDWDASRDAGTVYYKNMNEITNGVDTNIESNFSYDTYYIFKYQIDPSTKTFTLRYSKDDGLTWVKAYKNFHMRNPYDSNGSTYYSKAGVMPTGTLPSTITSFKLRENVNVENSENSYTYSIASIEVDQSDSQSSVTDDITLSSSLNTVTSTVGEGNGLLSWKITPPSGNTTAFTANMTVDSDNLTVDDRLIEITFTAKMPEAYYRLEGFPVLIGGDNKTYNFGLQAATPNNSTPTVQHMLFRNLGQYKTFKNNETTTDLTRPATLVSGVKYGSKDNSVAPASAGYYDYKFVIDPVAKEYRYWEKASSDADFTDADEIYKNCPGYPVAIDSLPSVISALRFGTGNGNAAGYVTAGEFSFKDISIKTLAPGKDDFAARITGRAYSMSATNSTDNATYSDATQTITTKLVNYGSESKSVTLLIAVFDTNGSLIKVAEKTVALTPGVNTVTFEDLPAADAVWNSSNQVKRDPDICQLFMWQDMTTIVPLANSPQL